MADRGRHRPHRRSLAGTRAGRHDPPVSLSHPGLSLRQRQRIYQRRHRSAAEQAAHPADQKPAPALQRQWTSRKQKRRRDPQAHGLRLHPPRARPVPPELLRRLLQSLSELPSPVRPGRPRHRPEGPPAQPLPALSNPAGNSAGPAAGGAVAAPRTFPRRLRTHRRPAQRHRSRPAHAAGQAQTPRRLPTPRTRAVEMTEPGNPPPNKNGGFPASLESANPAPFPHSHRPGGCYIFNSKSKAQGPTQKGAFLRPLPASFRLILRLEKTPSSDSGRYAVLHHYPDSITFLGQEHDHRESH